MQPTLTAARICGQPYVSDQAQRHRQFRRQGVGSTDVSRVRPGLHQTPRH